MNIVNINNAAEYYDRIARYYDEITSNMGQWIAPTLVYEYVQDILKKDDSVLDIGIGTGQSIEKIYQLKKIKIYGIDISTKMLEVCKHKFPETILLKGELTKIKHRLPTCFNLILSCGVFEYIKNIEEILKTVNDLLSKNGYFIFTFEPIIHLYGPQDSSKSLVFNQNSPNSDVNFWTYRYHFHELLYTLKRNNFKLIAQKEFVSYSTGKKSELIIFNHIVKAQKACS